MSRGCRDEGCELRHCVICRGHPTKTDPQACPRCVGRVGAALTAIGTAYAALAEELIATGSTSFEPLGRGTTGSKILGGDILVLLAPGNADGRPDPGVELASDPHPPLAILASWEDDFRRLRQMPAAETTTMPATIDFLRANLDWAARNHPALADFATEVFAIRTRLDTATQTTTAPDRGVGCPYCGERLIRRYAKPDPCPPTCTHDGPGHDQGGQRDGWECPNRNCARRYTPDEYRFAVWQAWAETRQNTAV